MILDYNCHFSYSVMTLCHFLAFFHLLNNLTEKADFWYVINVCFINSSGYG